MTPPRVYFDHAATTPMRAEAVEAMLPFLDNRFANPSGSHSEARLARRAVDDARERIAALLGCDFGEVVFTSGGTEADNLAVAGTWAGQAASGSTSEGARALVCSGIEHHAVLEPCRALARRTGAELRVVPAGKDGVVDLDALADACRADVGLVSVMTVNNETGVVQPVDAVAAIVRERSPGARFHTDAVQAASWLAVDRAAAPADLVAISAHKFGGPKGAGALVVREGTSLEPQILGGGQERERRSGTHHVAGIVAMAAALDASAGDRDERAARVRALRDRLVDGLIAGVPGAVETGARGCTVPGIAHLRVAGVEGESLVVLLDEAGIACSAGAACASGAVAASHVLEAMGLTRPEARGGIRFSLGATTTQEDVDRALAAVPAAVERLRD